MMVSQKQPQEQQQQQQEKVSSSVENTVDDRTTPQLVEEESRGGVEGGVGGKDNCTHDSDGDVRKDRDVPIASPSSPLLKEQSSAIPLALPSSLRQRTSESHSRISSLSLDDYVGGSSGALTMDSNVSSLDHSEDHQQTEDEHRCRQRDSYSTTYTATSDNISYETMQSEECIDTHEQEDSSQRHTKDKDIQQQQQAYPKRCSAKSYNGSTSSSGGGGGMNLSGNFVTPTTGRRLSSSKRSSISTQATSTHKRSSTASRISGAISMAEPLKTAKRKTNSLSGMTIDKLKLDFGNTIIGRDKELDRIQQSLKASQQHKQKHLLFVTGSDGAGKTSLVRSAIESATTKTAPGSTLFVEGKFDAQLKNEPYGGIAAIGNTICDHILSLHFQNNNTPKAKTDAPVIQDTSISSPTSMNLNQNTRRAQLSWSKSTKSARSFHIARGRSSNASTRSIFSKGSCKNHSSIHSNKTNKENSPVAFSEVVDALVNEMGSNELSVLNRLIPTIEELLDAAEFIDDDENEFQRSPATTVAIDASEKSTNTTSNNVATNTTRLVRQQSIALIQIERNNKKQKMLLSPSSGGGDKSSPYWRTSDNSLDSKQRFQLIFVRFLKVCSKFFHPLVILLIDLHFADINSLELIELMMIDPEIDNLFVVGTYNNKENNDNGYVFKKIQQLKQRSSLHNHRGSSEDSSQTTLGGSVGGGFGSVVSSTSNPRLGEGSILNVGSSSKILMQLRDGGAGPTVLPDYSDTEDDHGGENNCDDSDDDFGLMGESEIVGELPLLRAQSSLEQPEQPFRHQGQKPLLQDQQSLLSTPQMSSTASLRISNITLESLREESVLTIFNGESREANTALVSNMGNNRNSSSYGNETTTSTLTSTSTTEATDELYKVQEIEIGSLSLETVNEFVRHALDQTDNIDDDEEEQLADLAKLCYKRTHGNPYFLKLFLKFLYDEKLLVYNFGLFKFCWDIERIEEQTQATDNVVHLLTSKLSELPLQSQEVLRLASCLGNTFQARILTIVYEGYAQKAERNGKETSTSFSAGSGKAEMSDNYFAGNVELKAIMDTLIEAGYLECSDYDQDCSTGIDDENDPQDYIEFSFTNDNIREAISNSISSNIRMDLYYRVGEILVSRLNEDLLESTLFVVADLLNEGRPFPSVLEERMMLADFNRQAGRKAISFSAFEAAAEYAAKGIALLPRKWNAMMGRLNENDLDLALELYTIGAKAEAFMGNSGQVDLYSNKVISQKNLSMEYKLDIYTIWIDNLAYRGKMDEACKLGLDLLAKFNCRFPKSKVGILFHLTKFIKKVKGLLKNNRILDEYLFESMAVQIMDPTRQKLLVILDNLATILMNSNIQNHILPLVTIRNLEWTMHYGVNDYSAVGLATTAVVFAGYLGEFELAAKLANSALVLYPKVGNSHEARILMLVHGCVTHWTTRIRENMKPLLHAYELGIRSGDTESAGWAMLSFIQLRWVTSFSLELAVADLDAYTTQMKDFNRLLLYEYGLVYWEVYDNLLGCTTKMGEWSMELGGNRISKHDLDRICEVGNRFGSCVRTFQGILYCIYGEYEKCAEISHKYGHDEFMKTHPGLSVSYLEALTKGVSCYAAAHLTGKHKYRKDAKAIHRRVKHWLSKGNPNVKHYLYLLDAEQAVIRGKKDSAIRMYQKAVIKSARSGYLLEAGLASERLAALYLEHCQKEDAKFRLEDAHRYYSDLGAHRKVCLLKETHGDLLKDKI